jgi:hypothetical protein
MTSIVLLLLFQSLGTVQFVPEVRKMTRVLACDADGSDCRRKKEMVNMPNATASAAGDMMRVTSRKRFFISNCADEAAEADDAAAVGAGDFFVGIGAGADGIHRDDAIEIFDAARGGRIRIGCRRRACGDA